MSPDLFGWLVIGTLSFTLLLLAIREELLRRSGR